MLKKLILLGVACLSIIGYVIYASQLQPKAEIADEVTSRAILTIDNERRTLSAIANEYERVNAPAGQTIQIQLDELYFSKGEPIILEASNGGNLNGRIEPRQVLSSGFAFNFTTGIHRGLYTVKVKQGNRRELFEFWVGPERLIGEAGPNRVFVSPEERR